MKKLNLQKAIRRSVLHLWLLWILPALIFSGALSGCRRTKEVIITPPPNQATPHLGIPAPGDGGRMNQGGDPQMIKAWRQFSDDTTNRVLDERLRSHKETLFGYALVVGINEYGQKGSETIKLRNLKHPKREALEMKSILETCGYRVKLLVDQEATKEAILQWITLISEKCGKEKFLFYFSGHGTVYETKRKQSFSGNELNDLASKSIFSLVPHQPPPLPSSEPSSISLISFDEIMNILKQSSSPEKLFFIDACLAKENWACPSYPLPVYLSQLETQGFFFLSLFKEQNLDGEFSPVILDALRGRADASGGGNNDGVVSMFETITYVNEGLKKIYLNFGIKENRVKYICYGNGDLPITISRPYRKKGKK